MSRILSVRYALPSHSLHDIGIKANTPKQTSETRASERMRREEKRTSEPVTVGEKMSTLEIIFRKIIVIGLGMRIKSRTVKYSAVYLCLCVHIKKLIRKISPKNQTEREHC